MDNLFILDDLEIDSKNLTLIVKRFQNLHKQQLKRIQEGLSPRKKDFLELLPLLFHVNHPLLPGFVATNTPMGVYGYQPSPEALSSAAKLSKSFQFKTPLNQRFVIEGIYLMGSVGSIAYSNKSDFDIWLCHDPKLSFAELRDIKAKADKIEIWTESIGLETHFFMVNADDFRDGLNEPLSSESCGGVQHHLLLEEFYRTSVYIGGKFPAWWLIPPEYESCYTLFFKRLSEQRFINEAQFIDFGGLMDIPVDEFLGGTLWHLYKAIHSPHKSLLKLLLMESYASEFPMPDWLCTQIKAAVYMGDLNLDELDSYLYMFRKVEAYLTSRQEFDRLELARECFYLKINEVLSAPSDAFGKSSKRRMMLRVVVESWGWSSDRLKALDTRCSWNIEQILFEQRKMGQELLKSYLSITRFAREHNKEIRPKNAEIQLLGRCLHCTLERKPGKIEILSSEGYQEFELGELSLHEIVLADGEKEGWALYSGHIRRQDSKKPEPLKKAYGLIEILAWLVINRFYRKNKSIWLETSRSSLNQAELNKILNSLADFFGKHKSQVDDLNVYAKPSRIKASLLLFNISENHEAEQDNGLQLISDRFDPFSFGSDRISLIQSVDQINLTSWGEVLVCKYLGLTGLLDAFCLLFNQSHDALLDLDYVCFSRDRARAIMHRVKALAHDLMQSFHAAPARFIFRGESELCCFEKAESELSYMRFLDEEELIGDLATPRVQFSRVIFDGFSLKDWPLACIYRKNQPGLIQLFYSVQGKETTLFILDERGSLFYKVFLNPDSEIIVDRYSLFIHAIMQRYATEALSLECYRISPHPMRGWEALALDKIPAFNSKRLNIRVVAMRSASSQVIYSVFCNEIEFSSMDHGKNLFSVVAAHILKLRKNNEAYPFYISDIDVPAQLLGVSSPDQLQTLHFLKFKQKIESRLNL